MSQLNIAILKKAQREEWFILDLRADVLDNFNKKEVIAIM